MTNYLGSTLKYPRSASYDGEDKDEEIIYVLRRSYFTTVPWLFMSFFMLIVPFILDYALSTFKIKGIPVFDPGFRIAISMFWYLGTFGYFLQNILNWFYNVYIITNKKIIDVDFHGVLYKNIAETTLDNIEDVTSTISGALGVIFNVGDVHVQTAAERREFEFVSVDDPSSVRDLIADLSAEKRNDKNN